MLFQGRGSLDQAVCKHSLKGNCAPGVHVDVVAQLVSKETLTKTIISPFPYIVKYLFMYI